MAHDAYHFADQPIHDVPYRRTFVFRRTREAGPFGEKDVVHTNVPHLVVDHSPSGFDFGYGGSGPADLALNVLEATLRTIPDVADKQGRVSLHRGRAFRLAHALHQDFKREMIEPLPEGGGEIAFDDVVAWIRRKASPQRPSLQRLG